MPDCRSRSGIPWCTTLLVGGLFLAQGFAQNKAPANAPPAPTGAAAEQAAAPPGAGTTPGAPPPQAPVGGTAAAAGSTVPRTGNMAPEAWLRARMEEIFSRAQLGQAKVGLAVVDVESGRLIYGRNERALLNPASNAKLVTTAAALNLVGPEYRFRTTMATDGFSGGVAKSLYVRGTGDPSFETVDLWKLVSELHAFGIRKIVGDIVIDDTWFDGERLPPAFDQKQEDVAYRALTGANSLNANAYALTVLPGAKAGALVRTVLDPATPYLHISNLARTVARGLPLLSVTNSEADDHVQVLITGKLLRTSEPRSFVRRIPHPDLYFASVLRELLIKRGIALVPGQIRSGSMPQTAKVLATHQSLPLSILIREINKRSSNFMAEQVLKAVGAETFGRPGTWKKGLDAVARFLVENGIPRTSYQMKNGSGLYDANRFSAAQLAHLLRVVYRDFRVSADFVASLAIAGTDGTVARRMGGGGAERYVRAKTGTLDGVSCLTGYAGAVGHSPLAFSVLINDFEDAAAGEAKRVEDEVAETLVLYLEGLPK